MAAPLSNLWPLFLLALVAALGWMGGRPLFRAAEQGFWSLNALALQPGYAFCREGFRHLAEHLLMPRLGVRGRMRLGAATAAGAGIVLCGIALALVTLANRIFWLTIGTTRIHADTRLSGCCMLRCAVPLARKRHECLRRRGQLSFPQSHQTSPAAQLPTIEGPAEQLRIARGRSLRRRERPLCQRHCAPARAVLRADWRSWRS